MDFGGQSNIEEIDVDQVLSSVYGNGDSQPTDSPQKNEPTPIAEPAAPSFREFEFTHRGSPIKIAENDPRFTQWLSRGYDYSELQDKFKNERQEWDASKQQWEKDWNIYREIDGFAKENPQWWEKIQQGYQQKQENPYDIPEGVKAYLDQRFEPVIKDLPLMKEFLQDMQRQKQELAQKDEDTRLQTSIKDIQSKYANIDFAAKDESGQSLEQRVLSHAITNGFPTFRSAFLDYYQDNLEKMAEARGKEFITQEMAKRQKLGLLDKAPAPTTSSIMPSRSDGRPRSWNDPSLSSEAILREMNIR